MENHETLRLKHREGDACDCVCTSAAILCIVRPSEKFFTVYYSMNNFCTYNSTVLVCMVCIIV